MKKRARIVSGLAALGVLAALFLAPIAEASLSRSSTPAREAPALTLTSPAPEPSDFSLFEGDELTHAAAESESAPSFHPLVAVSLLDERVERELALPLELSYPKTRYRVFGLLGAPILGELRGVSLELHWRSASFSCGLASGTVGWLSQDPLGDRDSPNLYGFVGARPHEMTDPLGLGAEEDAENAAWFAGLSRRLADERARNARPPVPPLTPAPGRTPANPGALTRAYRAYEGFDERAGQAGSDSWGGCPGPSTLQKEAQDPHMGTCEGFHKNVGDIAGLGAKTAVKGGKLVIEQKAAEILFGGIAGVLARGGQLSRGQAQRRLIQSLGPDPFGGKGQAHHLFDFVEHSSPMGRKLEQWGVDLNSAQNGVWLPKEASDGVLAALHRGRSTNDYKQEVFRRLSTATNRDEALEVLDSVRRDLLSGELRINTAL